MKTIKLYITIFVAVLTVSSCEKEGDKLILSGHEAAELTASESSVVLSQENNDESVLSLSWSGSELNVSDDSMGVPSGVPGIRLQASASKNFESFVELEPDFSYYTFTGAKLNTLAKDAGLKPWVSSPLYFRIQSLLGENMSPKFSNVVSVDVTPYEIDMSRLFVLDKDQKDTLAVLHSPESDGEYKGFVAASAWLNCYFLEGDGTIWGNDSDPGTPFELSDDAISMWNCWFPGTGGHYYVTMSVNDLEWSATLLPEIVVTGDVPENDTLAFYKSFEQWAGLIDPSIENAQIFLHSDALFFNMSTGDSQGTETTLYFAESESGNLTLSDSPATFTLPTAASHTLIMDFSNPTEWTYTFTEGNHLPQEEEVIPYLYLPGTLDGETGGDWGFDNYISQLNDSLYAGVVYVNSNWGFQMYTKPEWGVPYFTMGTTEGTLVKNGPDNIPAPETGTYFITADTLNLTYSVLPMGDVVYISGLNDEWDFNTTLAKTDKGVYSGTVEVTAQSTDGFRIYRESNKWDEYWGGSAGELSYWGPNITDDTQAGTYMITVDFMNETYEMTLN
jgi:hypothetical protein